MTGRLKLFAAAALGLALATGAVANVSAQTNPDATKTQQVQPSKAVPAKGLHRSHRLHIAHLRHAHVQRVAHHLTGHRVAKAVTAKTTKQAATTTQRERHAMNHRTTKPTSVIR